MQVFQQAHQSIGPLFALFVTPQDNKRMYPLFQYYNNLKEFLIVLDLHISKRVSDGAGYDGSDDMSDVDNNTDEMYE